MNKERLLHAAKVVRNSPNPDAFSMDTYAYDCRTPACVLGHYAAAGCSPLGLKDGPSGPQLTWNGDKLAPDEAISYNSLEVLEYFGINAYDAEELFGFDGCDYAETPEEAADFIEEFVRGWSE